MKNKFTIIIETETPTKGVVRFERGALPPIELHYGEEDEGTKRDAINYVAELLNRLSTS